MCATRPCRTTKNSVWQARTVRMRAGNGLVVAALAAGGEPLVVHFAAYAGLR